jgi:hypothetical protein
MMQEINGTTMEYDESYGRQKATQNTRRETMGLSYEASSLGAPNMLRSSIRMVCNIIGYSKDTLWNCKKFEQTGKENI